MSTAEGRHKQAQTGGSFLTGVSEDRMVNSYAH